MNDIKLISSYFLPYQNANSFAIGKKILSISDKYNIDVFTYNLDGEIETSEYWKRRIEGMSINIITKHCNNIFIRIRDSIKSLKNINKKGDIIISYFHLSELAYLCYLLKKRDNIPWIAIYSDPPFHMSPFSHELNKNIKVKIKNIINSRIPTWITFKFSDKIIFNDMWQAKYILGKKYAKYKHKIKIIQMGVELTENFEMGADKIKRDEDKIVFRYLGELVGPRNGIEFLKAIDIFLDKKPQYSDKFVVEFYGKVASEESIQTYKTMKYKENVKFNKPVLYEDAQKLMRSANVLIVIDGNLNKLTEIYPYTPSKILDYIAAQKPIFGISMDKSPTHDICIETKNWWSNFEVNQIEEQFERCIQEYYKHNYPRVVLDKYSNKSKAVEFMNVIDELINTR